MNTPIVQLREKKKDILLILATVIFLAVSINFSTSFLSEIFSNYPMILFILCALCFVAGILLLNKIAFSATDHIVRLRGAIAYNMNNDVVEPISIIGYSFNDDFCQFLRAFVHENKAYSKLLSYEESSVVSTDRFDPDNLNHNTIINSVLEFAVLHRIQLHLGSYFVENEIDRSNIVTLTRNELGGDVLRNRVLDQLTKDMRERPAFSRHTDA